MKKQAFTLVTMMAFTLGARAEQAQPQIAASKTTCYGPTGTDCRKGPHTRPDIKGEGCPKSFRPEFRGNSLVLGFDDFRVEPNPGWRSCTFVVPVELRGGNWSAQVLNMHLLGQQSLSGPHTVGRVRSTMWLSIGDTDMIFSQFKEESTQVTSPQAGSRIDAWFISPNVSTKTTPASQLDLEVSVKLFLEDNGSASAMTSTWFRIDSVEYGLDWSSDLNLGALRNILDTLQKTSDQSAKQCQQKNHPQIAQALTDLTWAAGWLNWDLLQPSFDRGTLAQRAEQLRQKFKTARSWAKGNGQSKLTVEDYNRLITPVENLVNELLTFLGLPPEPVAYPY